MILPANPSPPGPQPSLATSSGQPACTIARKERAILPVLTWAAAGAVLLVYLATAAPCAWWGDGMELTCAAYTLGVPHPTGYPLYTLSGWLVIHILGWLDPGRAMTIYSAVLLALSCGLLIGFFRRAIDGQNEGEACATQSPCSCHLLPAMGVGLLVAFSRTLWEHATFAEVYPLTFFLGTIVLIVAWPRRGTPRRAAALGLIFGFAALNHYSISALGPLVALVTLRWAWTSKRPVRIILLALGCFLVMLLGYLYVPLRARANPLLNFGDPSSLERFWWFITGGQYKTIRIATDLPIVFEGLARWVRWWGGQWLPGDQTTTPLGFYTGLILLAVAGMGLGRLSRRRWEIGLGLLGSLLITAAFGAFYRIPDIAAYFLVGLPAMAVGWCMAVNWLFRRFPVPGQPYLLLARVLPALAALAVMGFHWQAVDKSDDDTPLTWGAAVMSHLPPGAVVLTMEDYDIYALWYQQMVLGVRTDAIVFGANFIYDEWYRRYFEAEGRQSIPSVIEKHPISTKPEFYARLFHGTILPTMAAEYRVFAVYRSTEFAQYLSPRLVAPLLDQAYFDASDRQGLLPGMSLYELHTNSILEKMTEEEMVREFSQWR